MRNPNFARRGSQNGFYKGPLTDRLWTRVKKTNTCWLWNGCTRKGYTRKGYGQISVVGKHAQPVHRVSYELKYGKIPTGLFVCHKCDVRNCVRPSHLFLGTLQDNITDAQRKGRMVGAHGDRNIMRRHPEIFMGERGPNAKLTNAQAATIRRTYIPRVTTRREIAKKYSVSESAIDRILSGDTYRATDA